VGGQPFYVYCIGKRRNSVARIVVVLMSHNHRLGFNVPLQCGGLLYYYWWPLKMANRATNCAATAQLICSMYLDQSFNNRYCFKRLTIMIFFSILSFLSSGYYSAWCTELGYLSFLNYETFGIELCLLSVLKSSLSVRKLKGFQ
jgi:hypothetical protein